MVGSDLERTPREHLRERPTGAPWSGTSAVRPRLVRCTKRGPWAAPGVAKGRGRVRATRSRDGTSRPGEPAGILPPCPTSDRDERSHAQHEPQPLTVAVVGATGVVGRTMIQVLNEREFPSGSCVCSPPGGRPGGPCRSTGRTHRDRRGHRRSVRWRRHRPVLAPAATSRVSSRPLRPPRGATVIDNSSRVADGPDGPARRLPGEPGRPGGPPGHHRQPELLDDAARAGPDGPARRGRPRAGRRRHVPGRLRHRRPRRSRELEGQIRAHVAGEPKDAPSTRTRSPSTRCPQIDVFLPNGYTKEEWKVVTREPQDPAPAGSARSRARPSACRCSSAHSEAVHVETREPITPDRARELFAAVPGVVVQDDPATLDLPARDRGRRVATRSSWAASARTRRSTDGRGLAFWVVSGQPAQGRGHERRRDRRGPRRAGLGPGRRGPRRAPYRAGAATRRRPGVTDAERRAALEAIAAEVRACTRCRLPRDAHEGRPGRGRPRHRGRVRRRGPGLQRGPRRAGRSSAGPAASWSSCSARIGWRREDVFITNVVKCRPPDNRDPSPTRSPRARRTCGASSRSSIRRSS